MKYLQVAVCFWGLLVPACSENKKSDADKKSISVKTLEVAITSQIANREYVGVVEEESASALSFMVAGTVLQVYVVERQKVQKRNAAG
jgi:hypothetical protein